MIFQVIQKLNLYLVAMLPNASSYFVYDRIHHAFVYTYQFIELVSVSSSSSCLLSKLDVIHMTCNRRCFLNLVHMFITNIQIINICIKFKIFQYFCFRCKKKELQILSILNTHNYVKKKLTLLKNCNQNSSNCFKLLIAFKKITLKTEHDS